MLTRSCCLELFNFLDKRSLPFGKYYPDIIVDKKEGGEPHILLIESNGMPNKVLKIEDANRTTDIRAFKCVVHHKDDEASCSESAFYVRVRDKYAALWPFLGIVAEVVVICLVIFICERRRAATAKDDMDDDDEDCKNSSRQRKTT